METFKQYLKRMHRLYKKQKGKCSKCGKEFTKDGYVTIVYNNNGLNGTLGCKRIECMRHKEVK